MGCNAWNHPAGCDCGWGGDTGGGGGGGGFNSPERPQPSGSGRWGRYEAAHLQSYTIPNARCPVCGAKVFFYQSEFGGRVFFDPPLGPPWPKHPCTDNREAASGPRGKKLTGVPSPDEKVRSRPSDATRSTGHAKARSGWHPLLDLKIRQMGPWQLLQGLDPIDNLRCQILTQGKLKECAPTFVRVEGPGRITCALEQLQGGKDGSIRVIYARGWFGVSSLDEARIAKAARSGDVAAMRTYAQSRSYRYLGRDNWISDVVQSVDLKAALFWFDKAAKVGSEEAKLEHAYLLDLIDLDAGHQKWLRSNPKLAIRLAPPEIRTPSPGSLAHAVCIRASDRIRDLGYLIESREEDEDDWMDKYYLEDMQPGEDYLQRIADRAHLPHLAEAIRRFLSSTSVPPFQS